MRVCSFLFIYLWKVGVLPWSVFITHPQLFVGMGVSEFRPSDNVGVVPYFQDRVQVIYGGGGGKGAGCVLCWILQCLKSGFFLESRECRFGLSCQSSLGKVPAMHHAEGFKLQPRYTIAVGFVI